jgi:hypothetical protein
METPRAQSTIISLLSPSSTAPEGYIGTLSLEDVLKSVLMATLKASTNSSLHAAYHILDDLETTKTCLSLPSKTLALANFYFDATLTSADRLATLMSATLLQGVANILELQGVTPAPSVWLVQRSTNRAPSPARSYAG